VNHQSHLNALLAKDAPPWGPTFWVKDDVSRAVKIGIADTATVGKDVPNAMGLWVDALLGILLARAGHPGSQAREGVPLITVDSLLTAAADANLPAHIMRLARDAANQYGETESTLTRTEYDRRVALQPTEREPARFAPDPQATEERRRVLGEEYVSHLNETLATVEGSHPTRCATFTLAYVLHFCVVDLGHRAFALNTESWPLPAGSDTRRQPRRPPQ